MKIAVLLNRRVLKVAIILTTMNKHYNHTSVIVCHTTAVLLSLRLVVSENSSKPCKRLFAVNILIQICVYLKLTKNALKNKSIFFPSAGSGTVTACGDVCCTFKFLYLKLFEEEGLWQRLCSLQPSSSGTAQNNLKVLIQTAWPQSKCGFQLTLKECYKSIHLLQEAFKYFWVSPQPLCK